MPWASRHGQGGVGKDPSSETRSPSAAKSLFPKMPLGNGAPSLESSVSQLLALPVPGAGKPRRQRITGRSRRVSPEGLLGPPAPLPSADPRPESAPPPQRHGPANQRARHPSPRQRAGQSAAGSPAWPRPLLTSPAGRCRNCQNGGPGPGEGERPITARLLLWCPMGARRPRGP